MALTEPPTKRCAKCGAEKPATREFFHWTSSRQGPRKKLHSYCIACLTKPRPTLEDRFWPKVIKGPDCWGWNASTVKGYGKIWLSGRNEPAHRVSYELHFGPIPEGLVVRHKCDNRACTNPEHLELGTTADNQRDKVVRGRSLKGERHSLAKLTNDEVRQIRRLHSEGVRSGKIAKRFGIDRTNVWQIATRRTWRHI